MTEIAKSKTFPATTEPGKTPSIQLLEKNALAFNMADEVAFTRHGDTIIQLGISKGDLEDTVFSLDANLKAWVNASRPTRISLAIDNVLNYGISDSFSLDSSNSYASSKAVFDGYNAMQAWVNENRPTRVTLDIDKVMNYGITDDVDADSPTTYASSRAVTTLKAQLNTIHNTYVTATDARLDSAEADILANAQAAATNLSEINATKVRVGTLETQVANLGSAGGDQATAIEAIETKNTARDALLAGLRTDTDNNASDISDNTAAIAANTSAISDNASEIAAVKARATSAEGRLDTNETAITALTAGQSTNDSRLTTNEAKLATAESDISALESTTSTLTATVATKAAQSEVDSINSRTGASETKIANLETQMATKASSSSVDSVNTLATGNAADLAALTLRVTASESDISTHAARKDNPHEVTAAQVGLSNVANNPTSDAINEENSSQNASSAAVKTVNDRVTSEVAAAIAHTDAEIAKLLGDSPQAALDTLAELGAALTNNGDAIATINGEIALRAPLTITDALDTRLTTAESTIATNVSKIAATESATADNAAAIGALDTRATDLESRSTTLEGRADAIETSATAEIAKVTALETLTSGHTDLITAEGLRIDATEAKNAAQDIAIADVAATASNNADDTTALTARVTTNEGKIAASEAAIATNASDISTNADAIAATNATVTSQGTALAANDALTSTNASKIAALETLTEGHGTNLTTNNAKIAALETAAAENGSSGEANTAAIASNTAAISTNTSDIAQLRLDTDANTTKNAQDALAITAVEDRATDLETEQAAQGVRLTATETATSDNTAANAATQLLVDGLETNKADKSALTAHINDTSNPHNVTAAQVGLSNVPNYGISDSTTLDDSNSFASSKAIKTVNDRVTSEAAAAIAHTDAEIAKLLGGSPAAALDTLVELGEALTDNSDAISTITASLSTKATKVQVDALQAQVDAADTSAGQMRTDFNDYLVKQRIPTQAAYRKASANRAKDVAGSGFNNLGNVKVDEGYTKAIDGVFVDATKTNTIFFDIATSVGGVGGSDVLSATIAGVDLTITGHGNTDIVGGNNLPLPAPENGLTKKDGSGLHSDLAAAVVAGGAGMTASKLAVTDVVALLKRAPGHEHNVTQSGTVYPYANEQFNRTTAFGLATNTTVSSRLTGYGAVNSYSSTKAFNIASLDDAELEILYSEESNNLFRAANGDIMQDTSRFEVVRVNDEVDSKFDRDSLMARAGFTPTDVDGEWTITIESVKYIAIPVFGLPRTNVGIASPGNPRGVGKPNLKATWWEDREYRSAEQCFNSNLAVGSGLAASGLSADPLNTGEDSFADVIRPEGVIDLRMSTKVVSAEEFLRLASNESLLGSSAGVAVIPTHQRRVELVGASDFVDGSGFVTGMEEGSVWEVKFKTTNNAAGHGYDSPWVYRPSHNGGYLLLADGTKIEIDHSGVILDPTNGDQIVLQARKSTNITNPFLGLVDSDMVLVEGIANGQGRVSTDLKEISYCSDVRQSHGTDFYPSAKELTDPAHFSLGLIVHCTDAELASGELQLDSVLTSNTIASYQGTANAARSAALVGNLKLGKVTSTVASVPAEPYDAIVTHNAGNFTEYNATPGVEYALGDVVLSTSWKHGGALAHSVAGARLACNNFDFFALPLTCKGTINPADGSRSALGAPLGHVTYNRAVDLAFTDNTDGIKFLPSVHKVNGVWTLGVKFKTLKYDIGFDDEDVIEITSASQVIDLAQQVHPKCYINTPELPNLNGKVIQYTGNSFDSITMSELSTFVVSSDNDNLVDEHGNQVYWDIWEGKEWGDDGTMPASASTAIVTNENGMEVLQGLRSIGSRYYAK